MPCDLSYPTSFHSLSFSLLSSHYPLSLKQANHTPTSGSLHMFFPLPGILLSWVATRSVPSIPSGLPSKVILPLKTSLAPPQNFNLPPTFHNPSALLFPPQCISLGSIIIYLSNYFILYPLHTWNVSSVRTEIFSSSSPAPRIVPDT